MSTGIYFTGDITADLRPDPGCPASMTTTIGGAAYFGAKAAAREIAVRKLAGVDSFYMGNLPRDYFGNLARDEFAQAGVRCDYARETDTISRLAVVTPRPRGGNHFEFYNHYASEAQQTVQLEDLPQIMNERNQIFSFGSTLIRPGPAREAMQAYARQKSVEGHVTFFDFNTRPSLIVDKQHYINQLLDLSALTTCVKASDEDLSFIYPSNTGHQDIADMFLEQGCDAFIITYGSEGSAVYTRDGRAFAKTNNLEGITNTVGAGDSFNAGLLVALAAHGTSYDSAVREMSVKHWGGILHDANRVAQNHLRVINNIPGGHTYGCGKPCSRTAAYGYDIT